MSKETEMNSPAFEGVNEVDLALTMSPDKSNASQSVPRPAGRKSNEIASRSPQ